MSRFFFLLALTASLPAMADVADSFVCKLNLKRGPQTQAFQLIQTVASLRKTIDYPSLDGRNLIVTQGEIPFEIYFGWEKITVRYTYRFALDSQLAVAARWKCFSASIETADGLDSFSCGDQNRRDNPFNDTNQRWRPARVIDGIPQWQPDDSFSETFSSGGNSLTLECRKEPQ